MRPALKVLLCGSFSTGKTTTLTELRQAMDRRGIRGVVLDEPARACPLPLHAGQGLATSGWLLGEIIRGECALSGAQVLLCDGGPPGVVAHDRAAGGHGNDVVSAVAEAWMPTYDLVYRAEVDHTIPVRADDLRAVDPVYRDDVERILVDWCARTGVHATTLPHPPRDRVDLMCRSIAALISSW